MPTFQYVPVDEETKAVMQKYRDLYEALYNEIMPLVDRRGKALALTKLEESAFWLNKAITKND